jgi:hypothetical protein
MRFSPLVMGPRPNVKEAKMQPRHRLQRNLFEEEHAVPEVPAAQRSVLVRLIERLLVEALASDGGEMGVDTPVTKEAAHEQDHV